MIKKYYLIFTRRKGSAAIILSLIVSGSVLSTIFLSQESVNSFLFAESEKAEDWEYNFAAKNGLILGAYLISNNLILCREKGWDGYGALCKWNDSSSKQLSDFTGLNDPPVVKTKSGKRVLTIKSKVNGDIINNPVSDGTDIKYEMVFDLIDWKDSSAANLIGEIPTGVCRNSDMTMHSSGSCTSLDQIQCKDEHDNDIPNTVCEQISGMDQDHTIVLISITAPLDDATKRRTLYAGIRRPFSMALVTIEEPGPICQLSCATANNAMALAECRGPFIPGASDSISVVKVKVTNQGPGAMYALSLMREDIYTADDTKVVKHTGDLFADAGKEVLFPGESFFFNDYVDCADNFSVSVSVSTTRSAAQRGTLSTSNPVNIHAQTFMTLSYQVGSMDEVVGSCMALNGVNQLALVEGTDPTACPAEYSPGELCGDNDEGACYYSNIEPRRTASFSINRDKHQVNIKSRNLKMLLNTVRYVPPH